MPPSGDIPKGKLSRGLVGGKIAAGLGGSYLLYAAGKPFLSALGKNDAKKRLLEKSAETLFNGLCQLRGTALKIAQMLSLELDLFPSEIRSQLERSYNEAPPMNRALARKALINAYGRPPEQVFASFEPTAFAAASLGQVHKAQARDGRQLAIKIQYPGIAQTIRNDVLLLKGLLRPFAEYRLIKPAIEEIELRLLEEADYRQEADNAEFFREHLNMERVHVPQPIREFCADNALCLSRLDGPPLNAWLRTGPSQRERDTVAQLLQDLFIRCLYDLHCIHADPNPGNFLIFPDLSIGLVDFGCVKRFDPDFVELFSQLPRSLQRDDSETWLRVLHSLGTLPPDADEALQREAIHIFQRYNAWLKKIFEPEIFDFGKEKDFIKEGKALSMSMKETWLQMNINPNFVFLDRTRYGLFRLFEKMEARVSFRNPHEWACPE